MAGSWRLDPSGRYRLRYRDEDGWWTDRVKTADGDTTQDPKGVRGTDFFVKGGGAAGRNAFRVAVTVLFLAPMVVIALSFWALGAGFCQDGRPAEECPSTDSANAVFNIAVVVMGGALLVCLAVLVGGARGRRHAPVDVIPQAIERHMRWNRKAIAAAVFATLSALVSLAVVFDHAAALGVVGVFTALLATVFGLRALAEINSASGHEIGALVAKAGLATGAVVTVGWTLTAVAGF